MAARLGARRSRHVAGAEQAGAGTAFRKTAGYGSAAGMGTAYRLGAGPRPGRASRLSAWTRLRFWGQRGGGFVLVPASRSAGVVVCAAAGAGGAGVGPA